jgi:hypothetical protein
MILKATTTPYILVSYNEQLQHGGQTNLLGENDTYFKA